MSSKPPFAPINFKTRFPALDGVRGLAVFLVFIGHYGGGSHGGLILRFLDAVRLHGWMGVDLFFVLSGFLITGILFDTREDSHFFQRFFARRSLRIFPVAYLVFAILFALTPILHYQWRRPQFFFLVYLGNFFANYHQTLYYVPSLTHPAAKAVISHFWSLCVEEQFYLLWPLAIWLIRDRVRLILLATAISLLALLLRLFIVFRFTPGFAAEALFPSLPFRMDSLLIGGILALLLRGHHAEVWQRRAKWVFLAAAMCLVLLFHLSTDGSFPWILTLGFSVIAVACTGLIATTLVTDSPAFRLFHLLPLRTLGKYSYGFYIYHLLFYWAWNRLLYVLLARVHSVALAGTLFIALVFSTTFVIAKLSYDFFEVLFLRYKSHFKYDSESLSRQKERVAQSH